MDLKIIFVMQTNILTISEFHTVIKVAIDAIRSAEHFISPH